MTPRSLLRETAKRFRDAGIPDPETDSALLLSFLTGCDPLRLRLDTDSELPSGILSNYDALVRRRLKREPLQYITGEASFFGYVFTVDKHVLIPRPETEELCSWCLNILPASGADVLDLCCGSGCIGITLAAERSSLRVTLADCSRNALDIAAKNAHRLDVRVSLHCGDLTEGLPSSSFDCIVSNPPYIPSADCACLQPEVMAEPVLALDGGSDGLSFYRRIASESSRILRKGGLLLLELGYGEAEAVSSMLQSAGYTGISIRKDIRGIPRMILAEFSSAEGICSIN